MNKMQTIHPWLVWRRKILMTMKLGVCFLLCTVFQVSARVTAQNERMNFKMHDASLKTILWALEKKSEMFFFYSVKDIEQVTGIDVVAENKTLDEILSEVLKNTGITYEVTHNTVVLRKGKVNAALPQSKTSEVTGKVTDRSGSPLPGVTILIKGTSLGTVTDTEGIFKIALPQKKDVVLVFSFIGMKTQEIVLKDDKPLKVVMQEDAKEIDEVVVTGIFNRKKDSFTGASATFDGEQLRSVGTQNVIASLKTLDPSFNVLENNEFGSDPNKLPDIEIRGKSSLISTRDELSEDPNQPLFILDGFESSLEAIYNLDMSRVASITILKDAASTAIYGSKASNGVVVVETIRPKSGKLNLAYSGNANVSWADLSSYNLMDASEKLRFENLVGRYDASNDVVKDVELKKSYYDKLADIARGVNTYWLSEPLRVGLNHRHSLYVDGGEGAFMFGIGLAYNGITGVMKESKRDNISGNIDLTYRLKKFQFMNKFDMNNTDSKDPIVAFSQYADANPYYTKYNENGEVERWLEYTDYIKAANPLYNAKQNSYNKGNNLSWSDKFIVEYTPVPTLKLRARFGFTHQSTQAEAFYSPLDTRFAETDFSERGSYGNTETQSNKYEGEFTLTYAKVLKEVHQFNIVLGGYLSALEAKSQGYSAIGFPVGDFTLPSFANSYPDGGSPAYNESTTRSVSGYVIGNYAYDNRYLLDFSYRVNGSSVFGTNKHYIGTWAVGLGWNIHKEKFAENWTWANMLKIRASYGMTGSQAFEPYQSIIMYEYYTQNRYRYNIGAMMMGLGNPDLKWQQTNQLNIGTDISVLGDRLALSANYYQNRSKNLLTDVTLPPSLGYGTYRENLGEIENKGYELEVRLGILKKKDLWLNLTASGIHNTNILKKISNSLEAWNQAQDKSDENLNVPKVRYIEGESINSIWGVPSLGINPANGKETYLAADGSLTDRWQAKDQRVIGCTDPDLEGNLGLNAGWKGLQLNLYFTYRIGGQNYNYTLVDRLENADKRYNTDRRVLEQRWQQPGDITFFKDVKDESQTRPTSRFVEDYNYLQLSALNLSYDFPTPLTRKWRMENIRISFSMNDVFRASSIKAERGIDYPFARAFRTSLRVIF